MDPSCAHSLPLDSAACIFFKVSGLYTKANLHGCLLKQEGASRALSAKSLTNSSVIFTGFNER